MAIQAVHCKFDALFQIKRQVIAVQKFRFDPFGDDLRCQFSRCFLLVALVVSRPDAPVKGME